jgi:hypothetical protein
MASRKYPSLKIPFFLPQDLFFEHPEFKALVADTLSETSIKRRGVSI